jgi:nucleoside 2-deoxyribosyltransferase
MYMKWYIAGPLFNEMERVRNDNITHLVESCGVSTYLPQRDGGVFSEMFGTGDPSSLRKEIFIKDIEALRSCDGILCLLDGRVPDEGMCLELGMSYALGKKCIAFSTDSRINNKENMNIILEGMISELFLTEADLSNYLRTGE